MARGTSAPPSLARGAAVISLATAASRLTGFLRVVVVAAAMGTTYLANTYQTANTAPNLLFELVAAGVLTSVFVPTFVSYVVSGDAREGWRVADRLTSVALVALTVLAALLALAAPLVMRLLTVGVADPALRAREIDLGAAWLRLFAPQVVFYGLGMIMTGALHAHRRFALAAVAPIANNVVVICVYLAYALMRGARPPTLTGITGAEVTVLGLGTTLGVVAMTVCLLPSLRTLGWRFAWRFEPTHPAVRRAAHLGMWALSYAGGYQAGLVVVLILANQVEGGVAAYQWAYTFFYVPHALVAMPIGSVLFPALSEDVARGESESLVARLQEGLGMLAFLMMPTAALLVVLALPLASLTLNYGVMSGTGAALVGRVVAAFALGLPAYSAFLTLTRAYYALADTRTPALVNAASMAVSSVVGIVAFLLLPRPWAVPGLALGHSLGFSMGTAILMLILARRQPGFGAGPVLASVFRAALVGCAAAAVAAGLQRLLPGETKVQLLASVTISGACGALAYFGAMAALRARETSRLLAMARVLRRRAPA
jgi:putative peptidoglycan lipid II flippase